MIEAMARIEGSAAWTLALGQALLARALPEDVLPGRLGLGRC